MDKFERVEKTVVEKVDVICDICNTSCTKVHHPEYATFNANWGYGSDRDGEVWKSQLCEECAVATKEFLDARKAKNAAGVFVEKHSYFDSTPEEALKQLKYYCSTWTGMTYPEFIEYRENHNPEEFTDGLSVAEWHYKVAIS